MKTVRNDLLKLQRGILVHGCNAQGKMNSGIAKQVREKYPRAYDEYMKRYNAGELKVGDVIFVRVDTDLWIANAITQDRYGLDAQHVDYEALRKCFKAVREAANEVGARVYYPQIGAVRAGGDWKIISNIIDDELAGVDHALVLLPKDSAVAKRQAEELKRQRVKYEQ